MRTLSETLTVLIGFAEETITHPARVPNLAPDGVFPTLAREIRHADALPAEGVRTTRAALIMIVTLEEFFAGDRDPTDRWLGVAGVVLPLLRAEAWRAVRNEKEARGS